ncbi:MAG: hypothetical protein ACE366_31115 [Bradymonadia bacterium]
MSDLTVEHLTVMAQSEDPIHRCEAALHPNTPGTLLLQLAREWPAEVLENPAWPLFTLGSPQWGDHLDGALAQTLARQPRCPLEVLRWAIAREHTNTLISYAEQRAHDLGHRLKAAMGVRPRPMAFDWPRWQAALSDQTELVSQLTRAGMPWRVLDAPPPEDCPPLDPEEVDQLLACGLLGAHLVLMSSCALTPEQLTPLTAHPWPETRVLVAQSEHLDDSTFEALAADYETEVRGEIAVHPRCPTWLLLRLSHDTAVPVVAAAAHHPQLAPARLNALSTSSEERVRAAVAGNPSSPLSALEHLAADPTPSVLLELALNPSTPEHIRAKAGALSAQIVWAQANLPCPPDDPQAPAALRSLPKPYRYLVAMEGGVLPVVQHTFADDPDAQVREALSKCPFLVGSLRA